MKRLDEILKQVDRVPAFSQVARKVLIKLDDPDAMARELAEIIRLDQALAAGVLKTSNASYYGLQRQVSSVDDAVVVLGHGTLKDVVITCSAAGYFKGKVGTGYGQEEGELWKHSVAAGLMGKLLVRHLPGIEEGEAYTACLLHDIGKLVLNSFVAEDFARIVEKVRNEQFAFDEAEREILGITHQEVGARVLDRWDFPPAMVEAVRQHHDPDVLQKAPLSVLVALSNILVVSAGVGSGAGGMATKIKGEDLMRFNITTTILDYLLLELQEELEHAQELVSMQT